MNLTSLWTEAISQAKIRFSFHHAQEKRRI